MYHIVESQAEGISMTETDTAQDEVTWSFRVPMGIVRMVDRMLESQGHLNKSDLLRDAIREYAEKRGVSISDEKPQVA